MKLVEVNTVARGSTGTIMLSLARIVRERGGEAYTFSMARRDYIPADHAHIGTRAENLMNRLISGSTGISDVGCRRGTIKMLQRIDEIQPDVIHLHNLHGWYVNIPMLFRYIKERKIKTIWTLHDCWSFTAKCPHFTISGCQKWKDGCFGCPSLKDYPNTWVDQTRRMWKLKKKWFTGVEDLTIVTPSQWLADLVKQSFLKDYPVRVIHNGIDLDVFKPTPGDFRERYGIPASKKILLGVAFGWGLRKGLDVFIELARRLDSEKYQIVLVGTDDKVDKQLPSSIISIHRTHDQKELAEIYTAADLFVNPTREENYPTVNMEAIACGTPVLTFRTGGSPEIVNEKIGSVVDCDDLDALEREIIRISNDMPYLEADCVLEAQDFDMHQRFEEYVALYEEN